MSLNFVDQEVNPPLTPTIAEEIVRLGDIQINNFHGEEARQKHPLFPLFGSALHPIKPSHFWGFLLWENKGISREQLDQVGHFFQEPEVQDGIRVVHDGLMTGIDKQLVGGGGYSNLMLYPLVKELASRPPETFNEIFSNWREDWLKGVDPEKFRMAFTILFTYLSMWSTEAQERFIPFLNGQPVQASEADFLTGIFERVYVDTNDAEKIQEADRRGRELGLPPFSKEDIYHTADLPTLPQIIKKGLLANECLSLSSDGYNEANFAVSFHNFKEPPATVAELGTELKTGRDTMRTIAKKIHLAFLHPQEKVPPHCILYPPESFWLNRQSRTNNVAGRYIAGYDSDGSEFKNKTIAYVLIGMPSTATSFVMLDGNDREEYAKIAKDLPFYIPAYSYEGELIYKPEQYDKERINAS